MTYQEFNSFQPFSQVVLNIMSPLSGDNNFITEFQTFAPTISSEIVSYMYDPSCNCKGRISLYVELYKDQTATFIYDYISNNNLMPILDAAVVNSTVNYVVDIAGKVAVTSVEDWGDFTARVGEASFRNYSVALSGDKVLVFFM